MSTKKISELNNVGISLNDSGLLTPSTLIIPVYTRDGNNTTINGSINLPYLVLLIYSKVALWAAAAMNTGNYEEPTAPSGGGSSGGGEVSLAAFNALKNRVTALENGGGGSGSIDIGTFPTHTIRVIDLNGINHDSSLPCAPNSTNLLVEINLVDSNIEFSVGITVNNVFINGTDIGATVSATVSKGGGTGGTLSSIVINGSFICTSGGGSGSLPAETYTMIDQNNSYTVTGTKTHTANITGTGATGSQATVYINVRVNDEVDTTITCTVDNTASGTIYVK